MEEHYRLSLIKNFKKTVDDGYFSFIIVDSIHDKVVQFDEMASYAERRGFKVNITRIFVGFLELYLIAAISYAGVYRRDGSRSGALPPTKLARSNSA